MTASETFVICSQTGMNRCTDCGCSTLFLTPRILQYVQWLSLVLRRNICYVEYSYVRLPEYSEIVTMSYMVALFLDVLCQFVHDVDTWCHSIAEA